MMNKRLQRGFSLMELIMVMTIVGIVAVYAGAKWQGDLTLYPKTDQLMNDIRRAQALAMSRGVNFTILTVGADSYKIQDATGVAVDLQPTVLAGVTITSFAFTFDRMGDPGAVTQSVKLSMDGESVTIQVVGKTGVALKL